MFIEVDKNGRLVLSHELQETSDPASGDTLETEIDAISCDSSRTTLRREINAAQACIAAGRRPEFHTARAVLAFMRESGEF